MNENNLYPFQRDGVEFLTTIKPEMNGQPSMLLADEMSLGKTIQVICAAKKLRAKNGLVICPVSAKRQWARQMVEWELCAPQDIFIVDSTKDVIPDDAKYILVNFDLVIETFIYEQLYARQYAFMCIDEVSVLKSLTSKRSKQILGWTLWGTVHARAPLIERAVWKWYLDGTVAPNRAIELYPLLKTNCRHLLEPYDSYREFGKYFCGGWIDADGTCNFRGTSHAEELNSRLRPFMLRRLTKDVYKELPPYVVKKVYLTVPQEEIECTTENAWLSAARKALGIAKIPYALNYIREQQSLHGGKWLIFAYHREVIESLAKELNAPAYYGGTTSKQKDAILQAFIADDQIDYLVAQNSSGGRAIDGLQNVCHNQIIVERDWSSGLEEQMIFRLKRPGQKRITYAHILLAEGTLDERISWKNEEKGSKLKVLLAPNGKGENMSLEALLERIATASETIANHVKNGGGLDYGDKATGEKAAKNQNTGKSTSTSTTKNAPASKTEPAKSADAQSGTTTQTVLSMSLEEFKKECGKTLAELKAVFKEKGAKDVEKDAREAFAAVRDTFTGGGQIDTVKPEQYNELLSKVKDKAKEIKEQPAAAEEADSLGDL